MIVFLRIDLKKIGLQVYCKPCQKVSYPTNLNCSTCKNNFLVQHRNVRSRKTSLCPDCVKQLTISRNKEGATYVTMHTKGYKYKSNGKKYILEHRKNVEEFLERPLLDEEIIHHIDGNKVNNNIENLYLTNKVGHAIAHNSLENVAMKLVATGRIIFNREKGIYEIGS